MEQRGCNMLAESLKSHQRPSTSCRAVLGSEWSLSLSFPFCNMGLMTLSWLGDHEDSLSHANSHAALTGAPRWGVHLSWRLAELGKRSAGDPDTRRPAA